MNKVLAWRKAIQASALPSTTRFILLNLSVYMKDDGECFPSTKKQAADMGLSERTVCTHLEKAEKSGYIKKRPHGYSGKGWSRNRYKAFIPEGTEGHSVAISDIHGQGTESASVPKPLGTEYADNQALKEVQSNPSYNSSIENGVENNDHYLFAGEVIKLTEGDFKKWQRSAGVDENVLAKYLDDRDTWIATQPEGIQSNWFISTGRDIQRHFGNKRKL